MADFVGARLIRGPTGSLSLHSIMGHFRSNPDGRGAFAGENAADFDNPVVQDALAPLGIRYFRRLDAAPGWLGAQNPGGSDRSWRGRMA
jgi:hypothetical protein